LLALGRLYEFCSNKRFHLLKNDFISDEIGQKALDINSKIKHDKGIDLFEATSENDLLDYEKILNEYTTNYTVQTLGFRDSGNGIELLKMSAPFPSEKMADFEI